MKRMLISFSMFLSSASIVSLQADSLEVPSSTVEETAMLPLFSPVLLDDAQRKKQIQDENMEEVIAKVLYGSEHDIDKQAEMLAHDRKKLNEFIARLSAKEATDGNRRRGKREEAWRLLAEQYRDQALAKIISLSLKDVKVEEAIELVGKMININFVIDASVVGQVKQMHLSSVPAAYVLRLLLTHNRPELALLKELGVFRILPRTKAERIAFELVSVNRYRNFERKVVTINHQRISEVFKLRVEKMWQGITRGEASRSGYYLVFDDVSKKIFFRGKKEHVADFSSYLHQIDVRVPQVKIEARLVIANKDFEESFGLQWSNVFNRRAGIKRGVSFVGSGPLEVIKNNPTEQSKDSLMDWALNLFPVAGELTRSLHLPFVFGGSDLNTKRLNLVLSAAENRSEIKTILKPSLLTSHGQQAEILVGESIPIEVVVKETIEGSLRDITTVNYKDIGIKLKVRPLVSPDHSLVFLEIFVENSRRLPEPLGTTSKFPTIETTFSHSRVILKSGQTTLIGGLLKNENSKQKSGVPFLSRVPFLGYFFRGSRKFSEDKELLIFITPTVI